MNIFVSIVHKLCLYKICTWIFAYTEHTVQFNSRTAYTLLLGGTPLSWLLYLCSKICICLFIWKKVGQGVCVSELLPIAILDTTPSTYAYEESIFMSCLVRHFTGESQIYIFFLSRSEVIQLLSNYPYERKWVCGVFFQNKKIIKLSTRILYSHALRINSGTSL